ncbi:MAG: glycosyltransferase [Hydrococcus sp. Prado102]|jgi:glycosyltransferase involved in cell wall biosynthesis|nr:glycosyltransferase [Hydrococcus sp. Prado102]
MSNLAPKVSVVMSVYNGSRYLRQSIESILNQTRTDFEFVIVNDGSTDNSWEILTEYANLDRRIVLLDNKENIGLTKSLNKGLAQAQGDYIARQDADDVSLPNRLEKQATLLNERAEIVLCSCDIESIDGEGRPIHKIQRVCPPDIVAWYLLFYNHLAGHSQVMFRRKPVIELGGYCENYRYSQDYELWCRLVKVGKIAIVSEILLQQRFHQTSISAQKSGEQEACLLMQVEKNLENILNEALEQNEVKELHGFWIGHFWSAYFPDIKRVDIVQTRLKKIYRAFIKQYLSPNSPQPEILSEIRNSIGQQYIYWLKDIKGKPDWSAKIKIFFYACSWNPSRVLQLLSRKVL